MRGISAFGAGMAVWLCAATAGMTAPSLTVLCGVDEAWCAVMQKAYEAKTGLEIAMTRRSTGDILNQIRAEKAAPTVDVWWGGTGDTHLQAGSENLLEPYQPAHARDMLPWAQNFFAMSGGRSAGIYAGALGFAYNAELLRAAKLPAPTCWKDLTDIAYRGRIQSGNPNSSGTAFTRFACSSAVGMRPLLRSVTRTSCVAESAEARTRATAAPVISTRGSSSAIARLKSAWLRAHFSSACGGPFCDQNFGSAPPTSTSPRSGCITLVHAW